MGKFLSHRAQRAQDALKESKIPEIVISRPLKFKVYSLIKGYWALWEGLLENRPCDDTGYYKGQNSGTRP